MKRISFEMKNMDKGLIDLLKKAKKLGIKKITISNTGEQSFEFFDRPFDKFKPSKADIMGEMPERMPTDDEMLMYSTDEFDRIREEREKAYKYGD
jgi:pantothenate kinase